MRRLIAAIVFVVLAGTAAASAASPLAVLWTVRPDGTGRQAVEVLGVTGSILDRSPSGRFVVRTADGAVLEDADGTHAVALPGTERAGSFAFSPSGSELLFSVSSPTLSTSMVEVVRSDGTLVATVGGASSASWSPDGRSIVYRSGRNVELSRVGGPARLLARGAVDTPVLSPDGTRVAYACAYGNNGGTLCIAGKGGTRRYPGGGVTPLWSPNGKQVATTEFEHSANGVRLVDVASGSVRRVAVPFYYADDYRPLAWSPNGRTLLFERRCAAGLFHPYPCRVVAWAYEVATGKRRRLSIDGLSWSLVRWRGETITYVTNP